LNALPDIPFEPPTRTVGGWLPDPSQKLLLQAALLERESALPAFNGWLKRASRACIDAASWRLLPLLAENLKRLGQAPPPLLQRIESIHRYIWLRNMVHLNRARQAVQMIESQGVRTLLLKGAPLVHLHYKDPGLRSMEDFDVLIPTDKAWDTIQFLLRKRWRESFIQSKLDREWVANHHSLNFVGPDDTRLDLHWHIFPERVQPGNDDAFWNHAQPLEFNGAATLALSPTDELLAACLHGIRWERVPPIRWIADAHVILRGGASIEWRRMVEQARALGQLLPLRVALNTLRFEFGAAIPDETLRKLNAHQPDNRERYEFLRKVYSPDAASLQEALSLHSHRYKVCLEEWPEFRGPVGFCRYLQREWRLDDWKAAPLAAVSKVCRRGVRTIRDRLVSPSRRTS